MVHIAADRCIDLNDHGRSRGGVIRWEEAAVWPWSSPWPRATTLATSGRPKARPLAARRAAITSTPPRPGNRPAGGGDQEHKPSASLPARSCSANRTRRSTSRSTRAPVPGSAGPAAATPTFADHLARLQRRRAARHRRAADRAGTRGRAGDPPARRLHRRDGLVLQVHLGAARLDPGERAPRPPGRGPAGRRVLGRARAGVPGDLAPGQPGGAGVLAGLGRGHPHRLPRHPGRRPRAGPVRGRRADRHVLAAGHQPGR